jgi:hypothetical protein
MPNSQATLLPWLNVLPISKMMLAAERKITSGGENVVQPFF